MMTVIKNMLMSILNCFLIIGLFWGATPATAQTYSGHLTGHVTSLEITNDGAGLDYVVVGVDQPIHQDCGELTLTYDYTGTGDDMNPAPFHYSTLLTAKTAGLDVRIAYVRHTFPVTVCRIQAVNIQTPS